MKTYIHIYYLIIVLLISSVNGLHAQTISWIDQIGGQDTDQTWGGQCDSNGNYYLSGTIFGSCFFPQDTVLICNGYNDTFLAKFNSSGEGLWALRLGGYNPETYGEFMKAYYDSISGYIYLAGHFYGGVTFGSFSFQTQLHDIIIAKYTLDGNCVWAKQYGGAGSDLCFALTVDGTGNIYICGKNYETVDFGPDTVAKGGFLAKFDPEGNCIWAKKKFPFEVIIQFGLWMYGITASDSTILFSGDLNYKEVFAIDTIIINHPGYGSSLIVFFNEDGIAIKVKEGIAEMTGISASLETDQAGSIFLTGWFMDTITFDTTHLTSTTSNSDMFLVKYDHTGTLQWVRQAGADKASGANLFADGAGFAYVSGDFSGNAAFGGQNITSHSSVEDAFVARYDPSGQCLGVMHWGNCSATGVSEDPDKNPIITLKFRTSCTIENTTFNSRGDFDILVMKTSPITSTKETSDTPSKQLLIYANPTTGKCTITIPEEFRHEEELTLYVYDSQGRLVQQAPIQRTSETYRLDIQAQASGVYQAVLTDGRRSVSGRIVFNK